MDKDQVPTRFQLFTVPAEGQQTPDFIDGGAGDDTISVQDGDTVIGGDGADTIRLNRSLGAENAAIVIEDFDTQEDVLTVSFRGTDDTLIATDETLEFIVDEDAGDVTVLLRDGPIAFLCGLHASEIDNIFVAKFDPFNQL